MVSVGTISYGAGALAFGALSLVLLIGWRGRTQGGLLVLAAMVTAVWSGTLAVDAYRYLAFPTLLHSLEIVSDGAWFVFLLKILSYAQTDQEKSRRRLPFSSFALPLAGIALLITLAHAYVPPSVWGEARATQLVLASHVLLAVMGLVLVEQLFRNTRSSQRWAIKYLCLGLGGMFIYDFYLYSDALLFGALDSSLWQARGAIYLLVAPLIAVSAARNPDWSLDVFVSRGFVFHTTTLLGTGAYLLLMAAAAYYIRIYGGSWGGAAQIAFLSAAVTLLLVVLFSGQYRARLKVFLSKHFFNYKYDYREEWLRFINTLSTSDDNEAVPLRERAIRAVARIVESPGGALYSRVEGGLFAPVAHWNFAELEQGPREPEDSSVIAFLRDRQWIVDVEEFEREPELYAGLDLPEWLRQSRRAWLVVPLLLHKEMLGFMVLAHARAPISLNWEDNDLLKTAGQQAASYLAQMEAAQALAESRQFEAFHRLSAYVVHDLKNISAQLGLIVSNAGRHKHNPAFVDDAMNTVENAVAKMNRLLTQLRHGRENTGSGTLVHLGKVLERVCAARQAQQPAPVLTATPGEFNVVAEADRLSSVLEHLIQNAQDATAETGKVMVRLKNHQQQAIIEVEDTGAGMDEPFIRERLFRPFDTTKGNAGMGIGAYEAREFVRSLGGEIDVVSRPNRGTTFFIKFPVARQRRSGEHEQAYKEAVN